MNESRCDKCRFSEFSVTNNELIEGAEAIGRCRKSVPTLDGKWPEVLASDWCGEFRLQTSPKTINGFDACKDHFSSSITTDGGID